MSRWALFAPTTPERQRFATRNAFGSGVQLTLTLSALLTPAMNAGSVLSRKVTHKPLIFLRMSKFSILHAELLERKLDAKKSAVNQRPSVTVEQLSASIGSTRLLASANRSHSAVVVQTTTIMNLWMLVRKAV